METERRRAHGRDRPRIEPSPQPTRPLDPMLDHHISAARAPFPSTKTTIARSMSRYKGARPKPPRSLSTPSVPAVPPVEPSAANLATARERPTTTFPRPLDAEDDQNDHFMPVLRETNDLPSDQNAISTAEAVQIPRPEYSLQASSHGRTNNIELQGPSPTRLRKGSLQRHQPEGSRMKGNSLRHARGDRALPPREAMTVREDTRRNALPTRSAMFQKKSFSERIVGLVSQPQSAAEAKEQLKSMISHPIAIDPKDHVPIPHFDAPKSAVNSGERTVRVRYRDFQVPVTVVPSTTPADVISSVSDKVATTIDQETSVMLESFKQLGLERPLRKYEHIRDVLNSWDNDSQNTLIIEHSLAGGQDDDLDVKHVPRKKPDDASFYLYHSQRPGHWDKRVVMVRSDGQMLVAKSNGGESSSICHLSDFDIYVPTAREVAKKIRPPKRICFAVKSQQKSNMFVSTANFVHFFASNDKRMAMSLYTAVQGWRSWYLVNMMGKGAKQSSQPIGSGQRQAVTTTNRHENLVQSPQRMKEAHRDNSNQSAPSHEASRPPATQRVQQAVAQDAHPAYRKNVQNDRHDRQVPATALTKPSSTPIAPMDPFTGGGLLGQTYTQRKKAQQDQEPRHSGTPIQIAAFSPPPIKAAANELKRSSSQRQKPKPLIDLTPVYQEPPQHSRKGKGVTPGHIPAGGLIDIATSPEVAIPIPPKCDWRRPGTNSGADASPTRGHQY
ncbi:hypothetical protein XANCAGTX0491_009413 [Xanthoria calcicola]